MSRFWITRRSAALAALALSWGCLAPAKPASAQATQASVRHATPITDTTRTTAAPQLTPAQQAQISAFVNTTVGYLKDTVTKDQQRYARADLEAAASPLVPGTQASGSYGVAYATALNKALLPLADKSQPLSVRLNAAIVAAKVASKVDNPALAPAALAFTNDGADAVALWGVKAGKYLFPRLLAVRQAGPYQAAIVKAVSTFRHDPALVEEAYDAFTGDWIVAGAAPGNGPGPTVPPAPTLMVAAIPAVVDLMRARAGIYEEAAAQVTAGADPDLVDPDADRSGYTFVALPVLWRASTVNDHKLMTRAGLDLMNQAMALMAILPKRLPGDPPEALRAGDLNPVIAQAGSAFAVISSLAGAQGNPFAAQAKALTPAAVGLGALDDVLRPRVEALSTALEGSGLVGPAVPLPKPPATTPSSPASTTPTTSPAGGPGR